MPQPNLRSGLIRTRYRTHAAVVLATITALTAAACGRTPVAKVTRTDGGAAVIGEVVTTRPDVVVLRLRAGDELAISRTAIQSIDVPTTDERVDYGAGRAGAEGGAQAGVSDGSTGGDAGKGDANREAGDAAGRRAEDGGSNTSGSNADNSNTGRPNDGGSNSGATSADGSGGSSGPGGARGPGGAGASSGPGGPGGPGRSAASNNAASGIAGGPGGTAGAAHDGAAAGGAFVVRDALIPENTALTVALDTAVASDRTTVNTPIEATLTAPVKVTEGIALPIGTRLRGAITEAVPSSLARGRGRLTLHFHSLVISGETIPIDTDAVPFRAPGLTRDDAKKIGIGAAIGAGIGKVVSKTKRGLGIGGATGAAATAAVVGRKDVELARGAVVRVILNEPVALGAARNR